VTLPAGVARGRSRVRQREGVDRRGGGRVRPRPAGGEDAHRSERDWPDHPDGPAVLMAIKED